MFANIAFGFVFGMVRNAFAMLGMVVFAVMIYAVYDATHGVTTKIVEKAPVEALVERID